MTRALAFYLATQLQGLPFLDRIGGLVQTLEQEAGDGKGTLKRHPVTDLYYTNDCKGTGIKEMIPSTALKGLAYFEELDNRQLPSSTTKRLDFTAQLRLVIWLNPAKFQKEIESYLSLQAKQSILAKLLKPSYVNAAGLVAIKPGLSRVVSQDKIIFSRYTYNEAQSQYTLLPFQYFALDLEVSYSLPVTEDCFTIKVEDTACNPETIL